MKAYQGEVLHKTDIQKRFRDKARLAAAEPEQVRDQDWNDLDAIIANLIELLRVPVNNTK